MGETLKGTLSSPCDCTVHEQFALDSQFINRNQPLLDLLPDDAKPYVLARFHFDDISSLPVGRNVGFRISGDSSDRRGTIRQVRLLPNPGSVADGVASTDLRGLNSPSTISDVIVEIEPSEPLDRQQIDRPADVLLGDPRSNVGAGFESVWRHLRGWISALTARL